ncbi:deoxynucleotidyltransferase terminal-interacting protein 2 isoform X2 [Vanacampus margaritifer]
MVATRRGSRVCSPTKTNVEQRVEDLATPSTGRRTRSAASQVKNSTQRVLLETSSRLQEESGGRPTPLLRRCTRASRLHSPEQSCTPVGSTHEADVSDLESCCSVMSDVELTVTRSRAARKASQESSEAEVSSSRNVRSTRRRTPGKKVESSSSVVSESEPPTTCRRRSRRLAGTLNYAEEELSEADSCSSLGPPQKKVQSTRSRVAPVKAGDDKAGSSSSLPTESQRVTQSRRRSTKSSAKRQPEESDLSDTESLASQSSIRRSARSRKKVCPIPLNLDEASESSPTPSSRRTTRRTAAEKSCDSEGFESGSEYTVCSQQQAKTQSSSSQTVESEFDLTDGPSAPGSPCSSRTNSGSARLHRPLPSSTPVLETSPAGNAPHDSLLESTVVAEDADSTLLEEEKKTSVETEARPANLDGEEVLVEAAVATADQQGELSAEKQEEDSPAVEKMEEETGPSSSGATCEDVGADDGKDDDVHTQVSRDDRHLHGDVSGTQEDAEDMEVEQEANLQSSKEEEDIGEREPEAVAQVTPEEPPPEDAKATEKTSTSSPVASREDDETDAEEKDMGEGRDTKATENTTTSSTVASREDEGEESEDDDDTAERQVHTRKPEETAASVAEQRTPKKSPLKDTKATQKTTTSSTVASREDEEEESEDDDDTAERQIHSRKPEETAASVAEQRTPKKSPLKYTKATQKAVSLLESSEDEEDEEYEDISEQEDEDPGERQDPSGKAKKKAGAAGESLDGLFMVDTRPGQDIDEDYYTERLTQEEVVGAEEGEEEDEFVDEEAEDDEDDCGEAALLLSSRNPLLKEMSTRIDPGINMRRLGGLYITLDGGKSKPSSSSVNRQKGKKDQDEVMKKSVMGPDFEKKDAVPPYSETKQALKKKHRVEREKTTGDAWFNMKAPELTKELTNDLKLLKMRSSLDPKRFYKKNDRDGFPKYFQVATVVDNPVDFYHSRVPKKQRKRTMVEELLADAEFRSKNKKKYHNIVAEKAALASGKHKKFKKNKFHKKSEKVAK